MKVKALKISPAYETQLGKAYCGDSLNLIEQLEDPIDLAITSPPFALQRQKDYGNKAQGEYVDWLMQFAFRLKDKLSPTGSLTPPNFRHLSNG